MRLQRTPACGPTRVLAISSGGGHWAELLRLRPALAGCDVAFATTGDAYRSDVGSARFYSVRDATRWNKAALALLLLQVLRILLRERPHVVLSTGAAPGYLALRLGRLVGARTVWIDSFANAEVLSLSGQKAGRCADLWLTQWAHLARPGGPDYAGSVL